MSKPIVCDGLQLASVLQTGSDGDRYQMQQKLSDKAGRQTYLAQDSEQNEQVIIKILNFDNALTWDHFKLFEREAKTLQNLSHPAIPKYRDYLDLDSGDFKGFALVQTYIKAQSLESYLQAGCTFSEAEIKQLAESLLEILTYLHSQHPPVIHRDLKPSNILLGDRSGNHLGQVYLVDFGSVQTVASKESGTITIVGSYGYIPFEQFCGQAVPASDLYSLGMTLLYLATGVHPADLPQKQGEIQINNTGLSRPLEQWLKQMTSPRLDRRFPDAKSALNALIHHQACHQTQLQPLYTKVQLRRIHKTFEVIIPNTLTAKNVMGWLLTSFIVFFFLWFIVPVGILYLLACAFTGTSPFTGHGRSEKIKKLVINDKKIVCYSNLGKRTNLRSQIKRLCYARSYEFDHFYYDESNRKVRRGKVSVEPQLMIYIGSNVRDEYIIEGLTNAECWWIGQELSNFLNLELQVIYPTPKVPPEPSCGGGC